MAEGKKNKVGPFQVKDSALIALSTGIRAQNLREFREGLLEAPQSSIYHHFWGRLLQASFDEPEYNNDFASWASHALHEKALAEKLSVVDPTAYRDIEELRQDLVDIVEERLDESDLVPWAKADQQFYFIRSQIVIFDTGITIDEPSQLVKALPEMSGGSIFYHFIDARQRSPQHVDDFRAWLAGYKNGYNELHEQISAVDPYFATLKEIKEILSEIFKNYFSEASQ